MSGRAAIFDVDGTLVNTTTLFSFLRYWLASLGRPDQEYDEWRGRLRAMTAAGAPRRDTNRAYFAAYAGHPVTEVATCAEDWFRTESRRDDLFNQPALDRYASHVRAGDRTVLVSGSFPACLDPLVVVLRPDDVVCSRPEHQDGVYTGHIDVPMVGEAKAVAVTELAAQRGFSLTDSYAYGDHVSDLPVLRLVGFPVQVGSDAALAQHAAAGGWETLPAGTDPTR